LKLIVSQKEKNKYFGFRILHYKVSESCKSMFVEVANKKKIACKVLVKTIDGGAKSSEDYTKVDMILEFKYG